MLRSESVSQWVTDKHCQWSDTGPIINSEAWKTLSYPIYTLLLQISKCPLLCVSCVICLPLKLRNIFSYKYHVCFHIHAASFKGSLATVWLLWITLSLPSKVLVKRSQMNDWGKPWKAYKKLPPLHHPGLLSALSAEEDDHPSALISLHTTWPAWPGNQNMASTWMPSTTWSTPRAPPTSMASRRTF